MMILSGLIRHSKLSHQHHRVIQYIRLRSYQYQQDYFHHPISLNNNKRQVNVIHKDNMKYVIEKDNNSHSHEYIHNDQLYLSKYQQHDNNKSITVNDNIFQDVDNKVITGNDIVNKIHKYIMNIVLYNNKVSELKKFINDLDDKLNDIVLLKHHVVDCTNLFSALLVSPSERNISHINKNFISHQQDVESVKLIDSICGVLNKHVKKLECSNWTFQEVANLYYNLKDFSGDNKGVHQLLSSSLESLNNSMTRDVDGDISNVIHNVAKTSSGLARMSINEETTRRGYQLLADKLKDCSNNNNDQQEGNIHQLNARIRDVVSLFHSLQHHVVNCKELLSYIKNLTRFMSSDYVKNLPLTQNHILGDMMFSMKNMNLKNKEERVLLKTLNSLLLSNESRMISSLKSSCRALEGLQNMYDMDENVKCSIVHISRNIDQSQSSISSEILLSVMKGSL